MITLTVHLENYLKLRRQLGFKLRVQGILLSNFVRFAEKRRISFISTKLALEWATRLPHIQPTQKAKRLALVRRFASYLSAIEPRTEVPPKRLLGCQFHRRQPFLYRPEDIARLMEVAGQIHGDSPLKDRRHSGRRKPILTIRGSPAASGGVAADRNALSPVRFQRQRVLFVE